jgi:antitoxin component YwqK of YwqJK toxin-antitoxin module
MAQRELSRNKFTFLILYIFSLGCSQPKEDKIMNVVDKVDVSAIPNDTVSQSDPSLKLQNGIYYRHKKPYSGFIKDVYETDTLKTVGSYLNGNQHGTTKTYFPDGKLETLRNYRNGLAYGQHLGYWQNGNKKFDYNYFDDKREGIQKQWYESGSNYYALTFADDKEDGMQKAWRENGKLYINYEVKDGIRYGLQKSALCYTLKNGKLK